MASGDLHINPFYFAMLNTDEEQRRLIDMQEGINKYIGYILAITGFERDTIMQPTRKREVVEKRQQVMYLLRGLGGPLKEEHKRFDIHRLQSSYLFSLFEIGVLFRKDHATALYAANKIVDLKNVYPSFKEYMNKLERYMVEFHIEQVDRERGLKEGLKNMDEQTKGMLYLNKINAIAKDADHNLSDITTPAFKAIEKIIYEVRQARKAQL